MTVSTGPVTVECPVHRSTLRKRPKSENCAMVRGAHSYKYACAAPYKFILKFNFYCKRIGKWPFRSLEWHRNRIYLVGMCGPHRLLWTINTLNVWHFIGYFGVHPPPLGRSIDFWTAGSCGEWRWLAAHFQSPISIVVCHLPYCIDFVWLDRVLWFRESAPL